MDLAEQMTRDNVEVPVIMEKCCAAVEKYGLTSQGIYRISGTVARANSLKRAIDTGNVLYRLFKILSS